MALGDFTLFAIQEQWGLYLVPLLLIQSNVIFRPNIPTLLCELYTKKRFMEGLSFLQFSIWESINLGALNCLLVAVFLYADLFRSTSGGLETFGLKWAFLPSSIGNIIGQVTFNLLAKKYIGDLDKLQ